MASLLAARLARPGSLRIVLRSAVCTRLNSNTPYQVPIDTPTHTGQRWADDDPRNNRFLGHLKEVNTRFAIDLIAQEPIQVVHGRVAVSESGGALGHPRVFLNLDNGIATCPYSGQRFVASSYLRKHPELHKQFKFVYPTTQENEEDHH